MRQPKKIKAISKKKEKTIAGEIGSIFRATVRVRCLPEIAWEEYRDMSPFRLKNHVHDLIQQEVDRMGVSA